MKPSPRSVCRSGSHSRRTLADASDSQLLARASFRHGSSPAEDIGLAQVLFPYGVGIDTHSGFIQVCVLWVAAARKGAQNVCRKEKEFSTSWQDLLAAHEWTLRVLHSAPGEASRVASGTLRYCIESTGTYHMPVLRAWHGVPCVVNPLLAGPTRRKTDVLDARLLAHHSITGLWKPSFIPSDDAQQLRVIWASRAEALRRATRASNQINNIVLRFGHTFGRDCSMRSSQGEGILSDLLDGRIPSVPTVCPEGLPPSVRPRISDLFADMRTAIQRTRRATIETLNFAKSRDWPTGTGTMPGTNLLALFQSVPGVGETTALTWLAEACDPRRFQTDKQVAAFSGCDPSLKVSAGKVTSLVRRAGNARLHQALLYAASGLLRRPSDPLGAWGKSIAGRHKKGGYRKACGAIARRIAVGLWHVHRKGEAFSYDGYQLSTSISLPNVPLDSFLPRRAVLTLASEDIKTTAQLAAAYSAGKLATVYGLGAASITLIKDWVQKHARRKSFAQRRDPLAVGKAREYVLKCPTDKSLVYTPRPAASPPSAGRAASAPDSSAQSSRLGSALTHTPTRHTPHRKRVPASSVAHS